MTEAATVMATEDGVEEVSLPRRVGWRRTDGPEGLLEREWLVTNGLGGYASGTLSGAPTRRFHGPLVASLPAPLGRTMMLNHVAERLRLPDGTELPLTAFVPETGSAALPLSLAEFGLVGGRPVWRFEQDGIVLEKMLVMPHRQNTTHAGFRMLSAAGPVSLILEPFFDMRPHEGSVEGLVKTGPPVRLERVTSGIEIAQPDSPYPVLRLAVRAKEVAKFDGEPRSIELRYTIEQARGYDHRGQLHALGAFEIVLAPGDEVMFTASTEDWQRIEALSPTEVFAVDQQRRRQLLAAAPSQLRSGRAAELVLAADQFIIEPRARPRDETYLDAQGADACTVIAGYPWFTDWGRDTMISLEGLMLVTGRHAEAAGTLKTFAHHIRDGLIPNLFPEGKNDGLYHTADATLWFFHALDRYEQATGDSQTRRNLLPKLVDVVGRHFDGTHFGIGVDPQDGLRPEGAPGYQLTWMDAKVDDWVVTPRRGKAVEINALFYNALKVLEGWLREAESSGWSSQNPIAVRAEQIAVRAAILRASFNRRFWNEERGFLRDVVDGEDGRDDDSLRPNQLLAIALPNPVLEPERWGPVMRAVEEKLATPFGLRTLAPDHPNYKPRYDGDLRARDAAYHQGTVWGWLVGPFVDAWLKTYPDDRAGAERLLDGLDAELRNACIGSISEIYDAEPPYSPRGCVAQAWSVAESLRAMARIAGL